MVSIYDKNFSEFPFTIDELQMLQCKKMKFRHAQPCRYDEIQMIKKIYEIIQFHLMLVLITDYILKLLHAYNDNDVFVVILRNFEVL